VAKRFYKKVAVSETANGFHVTLDGRVLKTPGKKPLLCIGEIQAQCVAEEWQAQIDEIRPETMPCTRLMNVACELTPDKRPELISEFTKYCETDLLCYRASHPEDLVSLQNEKWQPVLDWAAKHHRIELATTDGLEAIVQPGQSLQNTTEIAKKLTDANLTLLLHFTACYGSAILALAVMEKHLDVSPAFELSRLDEAFQNEQWGEDDEAIAKNTALLVELTALSKLI
jgi:chaperone required for assembly of F1-ATPase